MIWTLPFGTGAGAQLVPASRRPDPVPGVNGGLTFDNPVGLAAGAGQEPRWHRWPMAPWAFRLS